MTWANGALGNFAFWGYNPEYITTWGTDIQCGSVDEVDRNLYCIFNAPALSMMSNPQNSIFAYREQLHATLAKQAEQMYLNWASTSLLNSENSIYQNKTGLTKVTENSNVPEETKQKANELIKKLDDIITKINTAKQLTDSNSMLSAANEITQELKALEPELKALSDEVAAAIKKANETTSTPTETDTDSTATDDSNPQGTADGAAIERSLAERAKAHEGQQGATSTEEDASSTGNTGSTGNTNGSKNTGNLGSEGPAATVEEPVETGVKLETAEQINNAALELVYSIESGDTDKLKETIDKLTMDNIIDFIDAYNNATMGKDFITDINEATKHEDTCQIGKKLLTLLHRKAVSLGIAQTPDFKAALNDFKDETNSWLNITDSTFIKSFNRMFNMIKNAENAQR